MKCGTNIANLVIVPPYGGLCYHNNMPGAEAISSAAHPRRSRLPLYVAKILPAAGERIIAARETVCAGFESMA